MKKRFIVSLIFSVCLIGWCLLRPGRPMGEGGPPGQGAMRGQRPPAIPDAALNKKALKEVGLAYAKDVEPLLKQACFDCHSTATVFPWYHQVPGVAQYLEHHVEEGKRHLDLTKGFPFAGHAPIVLRVRSIGRVVQRGSMPLWDYKLMHPASRLSAEQKKVITDWAEASFQKLSETARPYTLAPVAAAAH